MPALRLIRQGSHPTCLWDVFHFLAQQLRFFQARKKKKTFNWESENNPVIWMRAAWSPSDSHYKITWPADTIQTIPVFHWSCAGMMAGSKYTRLVCSISPRCLAYDGTAHTSVSHNHELWFYLDDFFPRALTPIHIKTYIPVLPFWSACPPLEIS